MHNLPVLEMAFPFPVMAPIFILSFFGFHFWKFSIWYGPQTGNLPLLVLGVTHFVPFLVLSYAISGTVIHWAPCRNWALCAWSHFRYGALPVPVGSFTGPHTETGLYVHGPISGTGLCQFRYGHSLGSVPKLGSMCVVPFPVRDSASSGTVIHWVPYRNWTLCVVGTPVGGFVGLWVCGFVVSVRTF